MVRALVNSLQGRLKTTTWTNENPGLSISEIQQSKEMAAIGRVRNAGRAI
jgi:hypothetical protein